MPKRLIVLSFLAVIVVVSVACGGSGNAIVGEWKVSNPETALEFFQDGTVTLAQSGRTYTGQYKFIDTSTIRLDMMGDLGPQAMVLKDISLPDTF